MAPPRKAPLRLLDRLIDAVAVAGFVGMLLATMGQIGFRYVLAIPVPWTEEMARLLFTWTMFLGAAIAVRQQEHIRMEFLLLRIPARAAIACGLFFDLMILGLLWILARGSGIMMGITWNSYLVALDWMRTGYLYLGELVAVALIVFYVLEEMVRGLRTLLTGGAR